MSKRIINSDRRDPSKIRKKAELGLSNVDNIGSSEILALARDLFKDEIYRGDLYASTEIRENIPFEIPLCEFTSRSTKFSVTVSFMSGTNVRSVVKANVLHTFDNYDNQAIDEETFNIEFESVGQALTSPTSTIFFTVYTKSNSKTAVLSLNVGGNLKNLYNIDSISYYFSDYVVISTGSSTQMGFTPIVPKILIGDERGSYITGYGVVKKDFYCKSGNRKHSSFTKSLAIFDKNSGHLISEESLNISSQGDKYDVPKINNVAFTGSKKITYDGKSTRDITITAKHGSGEVTKENAGDHHWDVLSKIPMVSYDASIRSISEPEESEPEVITTSTSTSAPTTTSSTSTPNSTITIYRGEGIESINDSYDYLVVFSVTKGQSLKFRFITKEGYECNSSCLYFESGEVSSEWYHIPQSCSGGNYDEIGFLSVSGSGSYYLSAELKSTPTPPYSSWDLRRTGSAQIISDEGTTTPTATTTQSPATTTTQSPTTTTTQSPSDSPTVPELLFTVTLKGSNNQTISSLVSASISNPTSERTVVSYIFYKEIFPAGVDLSINSIKMSPEYSQYIDITTRNIYLETDGTEGVYVYFKNPRYIYDEGHRSVNLIITLNYAPKIPSPGSGSGSSNGYEPVIDPNSLMNYYASAKLFDRTNSIRGGLCTLVDIPSLPDNINSFYGAIKTLQNYAKQTSQYNDEHVVSIGFLRNYTECLYHILNFLVEGFANVEELKPLSGQFWFHQIKESREGIVLESTSAEDLGYLPILPNDGEIIPIGFSTKNLSTFENDKNDKLKLICKNSNYKFRITQWQRNTHNWSPIQDCSEFKNEHEITLNSNLKQSHLRIEIKSDGDIYLNQNVLGKRDSIVVEFNNKVYNEKYISLKDYFLPNSIFRRSLKNDPSYIFPVSLYSIGYIKKSDESEKIFYRKFSNANQNLNQVCYYSTNFEDYSSTGGLIWHGLSDITDNTGEYCTSVLIPATQKISGSNGEILDNYLCLQGFSMISGLNIEVSSPLNLFKIKILTSSNYYKWSEELPSPNWNNKIKVFTLGYSNFEPSFLDLINTDGDSDTYYYHINDTTKNIKERFFIQIIPTKDRTELTDIESIGTITFSSSNNPSQKYLTINVGQRGASSDISLDEDSKDSLFGYNNIVFYKSSDDINYSGYLVCKFNSVSSEELNKLDNTIDAYDKNGVKIEDVSCKLKAINSIDYFKFRDYGSYNFKIDLNSLSNSDIPEEKNLLDKFFIVEFQSKSASSLSNIKKIRLNKLDEYRTLIQNKTYYPSELLKQNNLYSCSFIMASSLNINQYLNPTLSLNARVKVNNTESEINTSISASNRENIEFIEEPLLYYVKNDFSESINFIDYLSDITLNSIDKNTFTYENFNTNQLTYKVFNSIKYINSDGVLRTISNEFLYDPNQEIINPNENLNFKLVDENNGVNLSGYNVNAIRIDSRIVLFKILKNGNYEMIHTSRGSNIINVRIDLSLMNVDPFITSKLFIE